MKPTRARFFALSLLLAASTASAGGPELSIDPPALDWGTISPGERVERRFSLANMGQEDLVIEEVTTSCRCLSASLPQEIIPPGGAAELVVSFDPTGWSGGFTGFVVLRTNDPLRPVRRIEVKGRIAPAAGEMPEEAGAEADSADVEVPAEAGPPPPIPSSEGSGEGEPRSGGPSAPAMLREKERAGEGKVRVLFRPLPRVPGRKGPLPPRLPPPPPRGGDRLLRSGYARGLPGLPGMGGDARPAARRRAARHDRGEESAPGRGRDRGAS